MIPGDFRRYYEPFFGGGAVFFALGPLPATLSDYNNDLMQCYSQIRDIPEEVITALNALPNSEEDYYRIRGELPQTGAERAARLIYLSALSFNGIHRINNTGGFNVPYCKRPDINPCKPEQIRRVSRALADAELCSGDFEIILNDAKAGDLVYLDPPYTLAHRNNGFVKYNEKMFHWDDQKRLARLAKELDRRGCHLIISNADHTSLRELYAAFRTLTVWRSSGIAADGKHRQPITECIFHNLQHIEDENDAR